MPAGPTVYSKSGGGGSTLGYGSTVFIDDIQTAGTAGTIVATSGVFNQIRPLNTLRGDLSFCTLVSNVFTLAAGRYVLSGWTCMTGSNIQFFRYRLFDNTNNVVKTDLQGIDIISQSQYYQQSNTTPCMITGYFEVLVPTDFIIQYMSSNGGLWGNVGGSTVSERLASFGFTKVA